MLPLPAFLAAVACGRRRKAVGYGLTAVAVAAVTLGLFALADVPPDERPWPQFWKQSGVFPAVNFAAVFLALLGGVVLTTLWAERDPRLRCPEGHLLDDPARVVATRCCLTCGRRVIEEPPVEPPQQLPTFAEVEGAVRAACKGRLAVLAFGAAVALWCGTCGLAPMVAVAWAWEWVTGRLTDWLVWKLYGPFFCAAFATTLAAGVVTDRECAARLALWPVLKCAHCRGRLDRRLDVLRATGNCPRCGRPAVALTSPALSDTAPPR